MATHGDRAYTMADHVKRLGPDNKIARIAEILDQNNPITEHAPIFEANNGTSHTTTVRSALPKSEWRRLNRGVKPSKSRTTQQDEQTGILEAWSEVDQTLLDATDDENGVLLSESKPFLQSMKQHMAETLIYGSRGADPASFNGLHSRYFTLNKEVKQTARNVIDMGGTGSDLTSVWLIVWGEMTIHLIHPKGIPLGITNKVFREQVLFDDDKGQYEGVRSKFSWATGLVLRDWRYVVRLANIKASNLQDLLEYGGEDPAKSKLLRALVQGTKLVPDLGDGKPAIYMNRGVNTQLELMAMDKRNVTLTYEEVDGKPITRFRGIPIHQLDAIIDHEEAVTD